MPTVFLNVVFKPFFKIVPDTGQQLTVDRTNFLTDGFLSNHSTYGVCECKHAISNTPKGKKSNVERSGERGGHGTSPKREMRCPGNMFRTMVIDSFAVCAVAPSCWKWPTKRKRMPTTSSPPPPSAYLLSTTHSKDIRFPWVTLYILNLWSETRYLVWVTMRKE